MTPSSSTPRRWIVPALAVSLAVNAVLAGFFLIPSSPVTPEPVKPEAPYEVKVNPPAELTFELSGLPQRPAPNRVRLTIKCSKPVSSHDLAGAAKALAPDGKALPIEAGSSHANFAPVLEILVPDAMEKIELSISKDLAASLGCKPMAAAWHETIDIKAGEREMSVNNLRFGKASSGGFRLELDFSGRVDPLEAVKSIAIDPPAVIQMGGHSWCEGRYVLTGDFKPQTCYRVIFKKGLRTLDGQVLKEDQNRAVATGNLPALVKFLTAGPYFPSGRELELPVRVQNLAKMQVQVYRIYPNNLQAYLQHDNVDATAKEIAKVELATGVPINGSQIFRVPLEKLIGGRTPGLYQVNVRSATRGTQSRDYYDDYYYERDSDNTQVVVSDLGLQATLGKGRVLATVLSLTGGAPVAGVAIEVLSRKNQPLGTATTDAGGTVAIALGEPDPSDPPVLLVARKGTDLSYLRLNANEHDLSQFPDAGRPHAGSRQACEALLHAERGVCRPGESIQLFAQVRDAVTLEAAGGIPAELVVTDPAGRVFRRQAVVPDAFGCLRVEVAVPREARTGNYGVSLGLPGLADGKSSFPEWGCTSFLVGAYVPDRLKVALTPAAKSVQPGEALKLDGTAKFYFGTPAGEAKVKVRVSPVAAAYNPPGWKEFTFGNPERKWQAPDFSWEGKSDAEGKFTCKYPGLSDKLPPPPATIKLRCSASVQEEGGRAVTATQEVTCHPNPWNLGLHQNKAVAGKPMSVAFDWAAVDPEGKLATMAADGLTYELFQETWDYVLAEEDGLYRCRWDKQRVKIAAAAVPGAAGTGRGTLELALPASGHFCLFLADAAGKIQTRSEFWHWQGEGGARQADPAVLSVKTDKECYLPGETAVVEFTAAAPGLAVLAAGARDAATLMTAPIVAGENRLRIPVPAGLAFGSWHVGVTVVHPDPTPAKTPRRLFGLIRLAVDQTARRLQVGMEAPAINRPGTTLKIPLTLTGADGKPSAGEVQLWAVDAGILSLTAYKTPDPLDFFFGPRSCSLQFADIYDSLYPLLPAGKESAVGGDGGMPAAGLLNRFPPEEVKAAIVLLPPVMIPESGRAEVEMTLPEHTGALRLMAVACSRTAAGSTERELVLRDAISLTVSGPRAVSPGDEFELVLQGFNHDLPEVAARWQVTTTGPVECLGEVSGELPLAKGGNAVRRLRCRAAAGVGAAAISVSLEANGIRRTAKTPLSVRPGLPPLALGRTDILPAGPARILAPPPGAWVKDTAQARLVISSSPSAELLGALDWLGNYPYGCVEQTTSAAFPFLAVASLVKAGVLPAAMADEARAKIQAGSSRLSLMELPSGGFSMWPGGDQLWPEGALFAAHFLIEADLAGVTLDAERKHRLIGWLKSLVENRDRPVGQRAYACYVLALAGIPASGSAGELLADAKASFPRFLAAAALIKSGRAKEGAAAMETLLGGNPWLTEDRDYRLDSDVRRAGMALWILMDILPESPKTVALAELLRNKIRPDGHWGYTHANAWASLGLSRWAAAYGAGKGSGKVKLADGTVVEIAAGGRQEFVIPAEAKVSVESTGTGPLFVRWSVRGVPTTPPPAGGTLKVSRRYLDAQGNPATSFAQGEVVTVELRLKAAAEVDNLVLVDLLPGGLEIEDERLATRWSPVTTAQAEKRRDALHLRFLEKRDDRFLLFADLTNTNEVVFTYTARAVTKGRYLIPPTLAEAMYDPDLQGVSAPAGMLEVK